MKTTVQAVLIAMTTVLVLTGTAAAPVLAAPGTPDRITARDGRLVDDQGRTVLIHGVNNVDKTTPYIEPGDGITLTERDAADLSRHGINAVRLGVSFDGLMPTEGVIDTAYIGRVVRVVDTLSAHGIRTLLDNHQDGLSSPWGGNGFPAWSLRARPGPGEPNPGFPLFYLMPSMNAAWDEVWSNRYGVLDHLGDALAALAGALRGRPGLLGIELLNEPWPGTAAVTCFPFGCPLFDRQYQRALERLTGRIRRVDPTVPVYWEPNVTWNQMMPSYLGIAGRRFGNVVIAPHDYCIPSQLAIYLGLPKEATALCGAQQDLTWTHVDEVRRRTGRPVVITEFGDVDPTVLENTLSRADRRNSGWMYWHYNSRYTEGRTRPDPLGGAVGRSLVRTYPQATAGRPLSMTFDSRTGAFDYTFVPDPRITAPTVIYVSDVHCPDGFEVDVSGGSYSVDESGKALIRAESNRQVRVQITPRR
ncbi:cellulase family glycosylhydrolase [Gordonia neofelifaecis]|uniref:Endoglycosylceramidase n=1 Tax=Gordonia neofelifaecis NRRL B-59395 TaxID=644548 RepID=F1YFJ8_9ACTN|nr:cellulase family glycosylhydrolase [Gordonia neofelifaecis]EGD56382.1 endoglycosylceramidase [Gordonia neofelifaecis NRRL B-59395]